MNHDFEPDIARALAPLRDMDTPEFMTEGSEPEPARSEGRWRILAAAAVIVVGLLAWAANSISNGSTAVATSVEESTTSIPGEAESAAPSTQAPQNLFDTEPTECTVDTLTTWLGQGEAPATQIEQLVIEADLVLQGQIAIVDSESGSTTFTVKPTRDLLGSESTLPQQITASGSAGRSGLLGASFIAFISDSQVLPGGLWVGCSTESSTISALSSDPDPSWNPGSLATIEDLVLQTQIMSNDVETVLDGDSVVARIDLLDGSSLRLQMPAIVGPGVSVTPNLKPLAATIAGDDFTAEVTIGFCNSEVDRSHATGMSVVSERRGTSAVGRTLITLCRPDEFVQIDIEARFPASADDFDLVPVSVGRDWNEWMADEGLVVGQCCFEDRALYQDEVVLWANGATSSLVRAFDPQTLRLVWQLDLVDVIDKPEEWAGEASFLWFGDERRTLATTGFGYLISFDHATGEVDWLLNLEGRSPGFLASVGDSDVIITSDVSSEGDNSAPVIQRVDVETGAVTWTAVGRERTNIQWQQPVVSGDLVLFVDVSSLAEDPAEEEESGLAAFDSETGELLWTASLESTTEAFRAHDSIVSDRTREPPLLLALNVDGDVFRFDPSDGTTLWRSDVEAQQIFGLAPGAASVRSVNGDEFDISLRDGSRISE